VLEAGGGIVAHPDRHFGARAAEKDSTWHVHFRVTPAG
jgi:hypothetical protein